MTSELVSCIVPVFNGEDYLGEALDSILAQTHRPLDIIVVDDGSTDGTASIATAYGRSVRHVRQENAGPAAALNRGLDVAMGTFVAALAADDLWDPEKLSRQLDRFRVEPGLDLCVTYVQNFWVPELAEEAARLRESPVAKPMPGYSSVTLLARRALFDRVGRFEASLQHGHDLAWFLRAAEHGATMAMIPEVLVYRRLHAANRSRHLAANSQRAFLAILKASLDRRRRGGAAAAYQFPDSERESIPGRLPTGTAQRHRPQDGSTPDEGEAP